MTTRASVGLDGPLVAQLCKDTPAGADDAALVERLQEAQPERLVQLARVGHEWYRLGGVIDRDGRRVAHDLMEWSERAFLECGQNLQTMVAHCREQRLIATLQRGVTLYITVRTGQRAQDFLQIEIDRTQELAERYVVGPCDAPSDLEEVIDPLEPARVTPYAVAPPRYAYRRKTDVALFLAELAQHRAEPHPAQRFVDDWNRSSARQGSRSFCQQWTLRLSQHTGRHNERIMKVDMVAASDNGPAHLSDVAAVRGKALASLLNHFDMDAGYPFAWYFHMLKGLGVSPHVGEAVFSDLSRDYAYLPAKDAQVLADWVAAPYFV